MSGEVSSGESAGGIDFFLSEQHKPNISRPYLLVIGNITIGDYSVIEYNSLEDARKREIKENEQSKLTKILKVVPYDKDSLEGIFGYAVHKFEDGNQSKDLPLSIEDVFIGKSLNLCKEEAKKKREKYLVKDKLDNLYVNFRPDEVIISLLYEVKER